MNIVLKLKNYFTKCLILHPVMRPNKGPQIQQYLAQQAIGLASSLKWEIIKGPFWAGQQNVKSKKGFHMKQNLVYVETDANEIRDGTYIRTSVGNGIYYDKGIIFQGQQTQSDGDLYQQWRNVRLRQSLANSSLIRVKRVTQKTFFTTGKLDIITSYLQYHDADCLFINTELRPGQVRNLKKVIEAKINGKPLPKGYGLGENSESETQLMTSEDNHENQNLQQQNSTTRTSYKRIQIFDRFSIVLQIFAKRATSTLSKLQIELSYLNYIRTRLVRQGSVYSSAYNIFQGDLMKANQINLQIISAKQRRAYGIMSGQGQSQLEIQRRTIKDKIAGINKQIQHQRHVRNENQKKMQKRNQINQDIPVIALVGYTNVGKSALMNKILKRKEVQSQDMLFQTLRTTSRHFYLPSGRKAILLDTIGFITNLPSQLFQSFKVTLEEINHADIIIHLRDISHPENKLQYQTIMNVLSSIQNGKKWIQQGNIMEVWNKVDLIKITQQSIQQSDVLTPQNRPQYLIQSKTKTQSSTQIVSKSQNNNNAQTKVINRKDLVKISATKGTGIAQFLNQLQQKVVNLRKHSQYKFVYSFQKHQKVLDWLKLNTNLPRDFPQKHDFTKTRQFPAGSVQITLQLDDRTYGKFIKFMGLTNPDQKASKRKQMPPAEGW